MAIPQESEQGARLLAHVDCVQAPKRCWCRAGSARSEFDRLGGKILDRREFFVDRLQGGQDLKERFPRRRLDDETLAFLAHDRIRALSSNSRGIRTAWFRPFLNSLTLRPEVASACGIGRDIGRASRSVNLNAGHYSAAAALPHIRA